jgi:hypothetical protein
VSDSPTDDNMLHFLTSGQQLSLSTVILTSGQQLVPVFDDMMLATSWSDQLIASGRGPTAICSSNKGKEGTRKFIEKLLAESGVIGVTLVFPDDELYWPLIKALTL